MVDTDRKQFQLHDASYKKLTNWKKEPTIQILKQDLELAKPSHDAQMSRIQKWDNLLTVKGDARPPKVKGRSSVQPKLIRRQAEWRYSALTEPFLGSDKLFKVSPVTFEDDDAAKQNEIVLNYQFRTKLNRVKFIDDFVRATVDEGTSIIRTGWKRTTVMVKEMAPVYSYMEIQDEQSAQQLQEAIALRDENPREFEEKVPKEIQEAVSYYDETGVPTVVQQVGEQAVQVEKIIENKPTAEILSPYNVFIDPSCNGDMDKALFAVISFETNKADLNKERKRYKNLDHVNWQGNSTLMEPDHDTKTPDTFQFNDPTRKKVVAYEYWGSYDIHDDGTLIPIVATWIGDTVIRMEENPYPDGKIPLTIVNYLPVKRDLYGEPDAELLEDNQKILGAVTRGMIDLLGRSANSQQGFSKGMLDALNRRRYENGQDYEYNPNQNPQQGLITHTYPEIPTSAYNMLQLQNQEAEALTGVKSFAGGVSGEAYGDVAAGIRGALDAASKREMAILRRLAKGIADIGNKIIAMNGEFLSDKEVVRVTNDKFVEVSREDLKGNFDLIADISTVEVDNAKAQDMAFMLQTMGPNSPPELAFMIMADIAELKRMPALAHKIRTFKPQPTPEQQKLQELEIQAKELENQKLMSEIKLNEAKAQRELSMKDKTDLDYVEQETGTTHERNLQQQRAQSRGNQNLQVVKALTTARKPDEKKPDIEAAIGFNQVSDKLGEDERVPSLPVGSGQAAPGMVPGL